MRVNVSKVFFSKTFTNGLKVLLQRQFTKSNKKSWEFYLNLKQKTFNITATQQLIKIYLLQFATFATLIILQLTLLYEFVIVIFISLNVFNRLKVLMNDLRLKTFYSKSINCSKLSRKSTTTSNKSVTSKILSSATTKNLITGFSSTSSSTGAAAAAAAIVFATSAIKQVTNKNNNHHHRTYNNKSKSNKVFLYYTPRDPHLRIFLKTKHSFFNRPQLQQQQFQVNKNKYIICYTTTGANKNLLKVFSDLFSYGELIGGGQKSGECISGDNKTFSKQLNSALLKTININCDSLTKISNNLIVATTGAAIVTNSAQIFIVIIIVVVLGDLTRDLRKTVEILSSIHYNRQQLKVSNINSSKFGLYECPV